MIKNFSEKILTSEINLLAAITEDVATDCSIESIIVGLS